VGGPRVEAGGVELPKSASRIVHPTRKAASPDSERGSSRERLFERNLEQDPRLAHRWQEVAYLTGIPDLGLRRLDLIRQGVERAASEERCAHRAGTAG